MHTRFTKEFDSLRDSLGMFLIGDPKRLSHYDGYCHVVIDQAMALLDTLTDETKVSLKDRKFFADLIFDTVEIYVTMRYWLKTHDVKHFERLKRLNEIHSEKTSSR